jgi:hypothetical protein
MENIEEHHQPEQEWNEIAHEMCIQIYYSELNEGYMYNVYDRADPELDKESPDGGLCTGRFEDAVQMATDIALSIAHAAEPSINYESEQVPTDRNEDEPEELKELERMRRDIEAREIDELER